ncbi:MAG: HAD family hydrolase [Kiritimatiellae bacterium]|nr:HAD family hydrolase [Kiritimatiellia bacterium]
MSAPYILWDWNGTLLDDTEAALATLNEMIAVRGGQPIGMEFYRDHFAFPVRPFYDKIGIVARNEDEWNGIAHEYHEVYGRQPKKLNPLAVTALEMAKEAGCRQSIVSALRQDLLEADMARNGVTKYFERICGSDNLDGASKLERARVLLRTLSETVPSDTHFVLIGDALHDKEVADALGIDCILCAQGSHAAWRLRAVAPTGDTLVDALKLALNEPAPRARRLAPTLHKVRFSS